MPYNFLVIVLALAAFAGLIKLFFFRKKDNSDELSMLKTPSSNESKPVKHSIPITERIRQMGLIEEDEFIEFYEPLFLKIEETYKNNNFDQIDPRFFESALKALRVRRSYIFSASQDDKPFYTYAIFSTICIRSIVRSANNGLFIPCLMNTFLIEKVLPKELLNQLKHKQILGHIFNSVTGINNDLSRFSLLIEETEAKVYSEHFSEISIFKKTLKTVIKGIINSYANNSIACYVYITKTYVWVSRELLLESVKFYNLKYEDSDTLDIEGLLEKTYKINKRNFSITLASDEDETQFEICGFIRFRQDELFGSQLFTSSKRIIAKLSEVKVDLVANSIATDQPQINKSSKDSTVIKSTDLFTPG